MSAGLMSCVRENSPPITMENSGAASLSSESQAENQKRRRRFHPLRNLRRIFRRRTLAHADTVRPIVQQHHHHHHYHQHSGRIKPTSASEDDFQTSHYLIQSSNPEPIMLPATKRAFFGTSTKDKRIFGAAGGGGSSSASGGNSYSESQQYHQYYVDADDGSTGSDLKREMTDYQRSLSEGRLVDNELSRDTLSQSHDSVFSESATASSLSIVLKAELADALRKRKSRSDASDEDLGLPRSPSTPPRNDHHVIDGNSNSSTGTGIRGNHHHLHSSLGLLSMASSESYDECSQSFLSTSKSLYDTSGKFSAIGDEFFPEMSLNGSGSSDTKLSHSAAKHKMAVRPKKKGPSRPNRKPVETLKVLPSTPEVNEEPMKMSTIDMHMPKSQSLPRGLSSKMVERHVATSAIKHTSIASVNVRSNEKSAAKSHDFDENAKVEVKHNSITTINVKKSEKREERSHSEEGFFRRFINRSGRKTKKERETAPADKDTVDSNAPHSYVKLSEPGAPAIKKSTELSIMDVLSKVRANDLPNSGDPKSVLNTYLTETNDHYSDQKTNKLHAKSSAMDNKPRSGPAARQRILPQDISSPSSTSSSPSADLISAEIACNQKQQYSDAQPMKSSPPRHDFATSFLRFSPPKSSSMSVSPDHVYDRASQYRSEEMLNTLNVNYDAHSTDEMATAPITASAPPRAMWPLETKFMQNAANRASTGWSQCQQKISKMANAVDQSLVQQSSKSPAKGKMVEKSKSFRLYSKNYNDMTVSPQPAKHGTGVSNMPSLPDLTSSNSRHSRHSTTNRESMQSLRFLSSRGGATSKWTPTRSSSSSRVAEHALANSNKFEINDFSLVPSKRAAATKSTLMSASITSDEISELELDRSINTTDSGSQSILVTSACKTPIHQNIDEIEDNIDKIMKSSYVTVLKKSPTADMYQIKSNPSAAGNAVSTSINASSTPTATATTTTTTTTNNNISLTTITKDDEPPMAKSALNFAMVENPPLVRHSMTATKLDIPIVPMSRSSVIDKVPEFMQIQLNRIDGTRPKSFVEYSSAGTGTPTHNDDDKERRFSNESIEISDKKKVAIVSSPTNVFGSNQQLNKSTESLKMGFNRSPIVGIVDGQQMSRGSSDDCLDADASGSDDSAPLGPSAVVARRKSVSDKKLKFEKKIEEIQAEVKRSSIIGLDKSAASVSRKSSIDDDTNTVVVVMRQKKSLTSKSSEDSDDPTPELMKVFARRSLKIKDTDDYIQLNTQSDNSNNNNSNSTNNNHQKKSAGAPDSDKENQVSGGGGDSINDDKTPSTVTVVPKVEIHIKSTPISVDYDIREKAEIFKKDQKVDVADRKSLHTTTNKTQSIAGPRFGGNTSISGNNYRNSSAFFENRNSVNLIIDCENAKNLNNNINNNNINTTKSTKNPISNVSAGAGSALARHTIAGCVVDDNVEAIAATAAAATVINGNDSNRSESEIEFKGILERRAEWEKRANQAFK